MWDNNTSADVYGLENQLSLRPNRRLLFTLAHAHLKADASWRHDINQANEPDDIRDISRSVPKHTLSSLFSYSLTPNLSWSLMYYSMSYMHWLQDGSKLHAYDRFDTRLAWTQHFSSDQQLKLALVLQNLGNAYREVQNQTVFQRRGFLTLSYEW